MLAEQFQSLAGADIGDDIADAVRIDLVGHFPRQAEEDGRIRGVAMARQGEGTIQTDADTRRIVQLSRRLKRMEKTVGGPHRPHGMGARRTDADLVQVEKGYDHVFSTVAPAFSRARWRAACSSQSTM